MSMVRYFKQRSISTAACETFQNVAKPRFLWIEAICSNQSNTEEQNDKVNMVGKIYLGASFHHSGSERKTRKV
jgi:hypothetical protein